MPRNCIYPQNTDVNEFLDDGFSPNPARCPYRTRWKPYTTPANNRCCQKAHVPIQGYGGVPATHVNFSDERPPRRPLALQNPKSCINQNESACYRNRRCNYDENHNVCEPMKWKPNQNCPGGSICGTCVPKNGPSDPRARECSDKYRCVLKDGAAWHRSCRGAAPDIPKHKEELKDEEAGKPPIKKVTHRRKGCNEFPELNEGEPEPRGWCPVQRCYRHTEAGKRVCRSAAPFSPQLYPEFSRDLVLQRAQIEAQIEEDEAMARQFERDEAAGQRLASPHVPLHFWGRSDCWCWECGRPSSGSGAGTLWKP